MGLFKSKGLADHPREVFNYRLFWSVGVFGMYLRILFDLPPCSSTVSIKEES
jgi:hypothetical protein